MREKEIPPFYMAGAASWEMAAILKKLENVNFGFLGQMNTKKISSGFELENVNFGFLGQMNTKKGLLH